MVLPINGVCQASKKEHLKENEKKQHSKKTIEKIVKKKKEVTSKKIQLIEKKHPKEKKISEKPIQKITKKVHNLLKPVKKNITNKKEKNKPSEKKIITSKQEIKVSLKNKIIQHKQTETKPKSKPIVKNAIPLKSKIDAPIVPIVESKINKIVEQKLPVKDSETITKPIEPENNITSTSNYLSDNIISDFSNEQYNDVIEKSKKYLLKNSNDTDIIIKTGLSYLFTNKYNKGFEMIDNVMGNKDSLVQYYSILPFINPHSKNEGVYENIVNHCQQIAPNSIWTSFAKATYFNTNENKDSALYFAKITNSTIKNNQEASALGYFYPTLLYHNGITDSAINILKNLCTKYPNNISLDFNLYQILKKEKQYADAYTYISKICTLDNLSEDYFQEKLEMCIALKKYDEACNLLKEVNKDFSYDTKIFKAKCKSEFATVPLQHQIKYTWKVNQKGEAFKVIGTIDASQEGKIIFNYNNTGKANNKGYYTVSSTSFDTARCVDATYFNTSKNIDSSKKLITWISKQCYNEIENSAQTLLNIGTGLGVFTLINNDGEDNDDANIFADRVLMQDGQMKLLETYHLINIETNEQIWILKNKKNPLIVKMDGIYTMELSEISN